MFCPECGTADQKIETYCRKCGTFLPDFDNLKKKETPPEEHLKANYILSLMTAIVSLALAISLYVVYLGKDSTPVLIYIVAGFLTAICAWQIQNFWRTLLLKKHFKKNQRVLGFEEDGFVQNSFQAEPTRELLNEADFENAIPASVTKKTTNKLGKKIKSK